MSGRATWTGLLKISLVTIPIKLYPATEESETLSFKQLHDPCQSRMTTKKWCPTCAKEVPTDEIVKGFEFEAGKYVVLIDEELDAVKPESTKVIDLVQFAEASTLPLVAIDRTYALAPDGKDGSPASQAFALMVDAMTDTVGIGTLTMYGREHLVAVGPVKGALMLYTLHHAAEVRTPPHVAAPAREIFSTAEIGQARRLIADMSQQPLRLADFVDTYQRDLRRLIDAKIAGEEIVQPTAIDARPVLNLRQALTQSLLAVNATKKTPAKAAMMTAKRKRA